MDQHTKEHIKEPPAVVTWPLIALAIPSVCIGGLTIDSMLFGDYFGAAVYVSESHNALAIVGQHFTSAWGFFQHGFAGLAFYLAAAGVAAAWFLYIFQPGSADYWAKKLSWIYRLLDKKYFFDEFNDWTFGGGSRGIGGRLWKYGDVTVIDGFFVNGSAKLVGWFSGVARKVQTGLLYHYAFAMIIGVLGLLVGFVLF
jgi:NADH-quinone oxidoreductase subunit L